MSNDKQWFIGEYRKKVEDTTKPPKFRYLQMKQWYLRYPSGRSYRAGKRLAMEFRRSDDPVVKQLGEDLRSYIIKKTFTRRKKLAPPPGATMKVPGSDGKWHWSDGVRDLGVVNG